MHRRGLLSSLVCGVAVIARCGEDVVDDEENEDDEVAAGLAAKSLPCTGSSAAGVSGASNSLGSSVNKRGKAS